MRISDWSSDVCSSDLLSSFPATPHAFRSRYPLPRPRRPVLAVGAARVEADRGLLRRIDPRDLQDRRALATDHRGRWRLRRAVGEPSGPVAQFLRLVDLANGMSVREDPRKVPFPTLHRTPPLFLAPAGEWGGVDNTHRSGVRETAG